MTDQKILELGTEGGSITIFQFLDNENNVRYYHAVEEQSFEEGIEGINRKSDVSISLPKALKRMIGEYSYALNFYPLYIQNEHSFTILRYLKENLKKTNENFDYYRWAELLLVDVEELRNKE